MALADASYMLGSAGAALADALVFAPADQAELVAHIRRYDPGYQPVGVAAQLNRNGIRALGQELYQTQLDYLDRVAGTCPADQQLYFDAQWAVYGAGEFSPVSQGQIREQYDQQYRSYQANGGVLSFEDWLAEGMPENNTEMPDGGTGAAFGSPVKLQEHFDRHGSDFEAQTAQEYQEQADAFLTGPLPDGALESVRTNGDVVRYDSATEEFGVVSVSGVIRTY